MIAVIAGWAIVVAAVTLAGCQSYSADTLVCMGFCAYREHETVCPKPEPKEETPWP